MPSLEAVEAFLVVNENELMQDFLIGLMAAPQLAVFLKNFRVCVRSLKAISLVGDDA